MFDHDLHKIKHGTSPVILHASTGTVVLATPKAVAPTPSVAVPSTLEMAAILGVVEASKCLEVPASTQHRSTVAATLELVLATVPILVPASHF